MKELKDVLKWCRRYLVPRFIRNWYVLRKWIRGNPLREIYLVDLREVRAQTIVSRMFSLVLHLANDGATAQRPFNLAIILSPEGFGCLSELYSVISLLPAANAGNVEFFRSLEDCQNHYHDLVLGLYKFQPLLADVPARSISSFQMPLWPIEPPVHYLNQARALLKIAARDRLVYFCDFSDLQSEKLPESWRHFFFTSISTEKDIVFLILAPAHIRQKDFIHPNVFYVQELGLNLLDHFALVSLADGFIGPLDVLASMALQRDRPTLLISNDLSESQLRPHIAVVKRNADFGELKSAFSSIRGKLKDQPMLVSESHSVAQV